MGIATGQGATAGTLAYVTTNSSIASLRNTVHHFVVTTFSTGLTVTMDGSQVLTCATSLPRRSWSGSPGNGWPDRYPCSPERVDHLWHPAPVAHRDPGVVVEGALGGTVLFLNAVSGSTLDVHNTGVSEVQGECTVTNGVVYIPSTTASWSLWGNS